MENNNCTKDNTLTIKCPECFNFMSAVIHDNGNRTGKCEKCNSTIIEKRHSNKKLIKILMQQ